MTAIKSPRRMGPTDAIWDVRLGGQTRLLCTTRLQALPALPCLPSSARFMGNIGCLCLTLERCTRAPWAGGRNDAGPAGTSGCFLIYADRRKWCWEEQWMDKLGQLEEQCQPSAQTNGVWWKLQGRTCLWWRYSNTNLTAIRLSRLVCCLK